jgi:cytochrome c
MRSLSCGLAILSMWLIPHSMRAAQDEAARPEFYIAHVKPIFENNCYRCHGGMNHRGSLSMATRAGMAKGGKDGAVIVPGDPTRSLLVRSIRHEKPPEKPMPPKSKLSDQDIATIERWVKAGAIMPEDRIPGR